MDDLRSGVSGFADDIARWRQAMPDRAPSYHRLLHELVAILQDGTRTAQELTERFDAAWRARTFRIFYDRPLVLLAALRADALAQGRDHPLWSALAAAEPDAGAVTRAALLEALARDSVWEAMRTGYVQTNETARALAWLWPAQIIGCGDGGRPLALVEIGASAGLNLVADRLAAPWTSVSGARLHTASAPRILARLGIDIHPLDARRDRDANWLRACVWPGEHERLERLDAAIAAFRSAPAQLVRGDVTDAPDALRALSAQHADATVVLAFQTIMRDYVDADTRVAYEREMRRWLADARAASALWVELEIDHADPAKRAPITAHLRNADGAVIDVVLGATSPHPQVVSVNDAAVEQLGRMFA